MPKRFTDTEKWKKRWIRELSTEYKLFWVYFLDVCNHAGIWDVDIPLTNFILNTKFTENDILSVFKDKIIVLDNGDKWFVPKFIEFQYGELNPENRVHNSVINHLNREGAYKGLTSPKKGCKDKDKIKDKDKDFNKPTIDEIKIYCKERKNQVDAEKFWNFYESKGWMVGKNKMKNWKSCIITWEKTNTQGNYSQPASQKREDGHTDFNPVSEAERKKVKDLISETAKNL